jgi:hypothetical protein
MGAPRSWHAVSGDEHRTSWRKRLTRVLPFELSSVPTKRVGGIVQWVVRANYSTRQAKSCSSSGRRDCSQ